MGNTLTRNADKASSMPIPSNRSVASSTTKLCSSKAIRSMSSLMRGQHFDSVASASLFWKEVGVAGQSVMGGLDQLVTAVFGEMAVGLADARGKEDGTMGKEASIIESW